jgi:O-antigen/teichoic acid export membrane protein
MCKLGYLVDLTVAGLALLVVLLTATFGARNFVHNTATTDLIIIYAVALVPHALAGTSNAVLTTLGYFPTIAAIEIGCTVLRVALVLGFVRAGWQVAGVIWGNAIASATSGLIYGAIAWVLMRRTWGRSVIHSDLGALWSERKQIFSFLAYNDLNALMATIPRQLDLLLLGYFRNPVEAGFYKLAKSFSSAADNLLGPLQSVTYAELSKLSALGDHHVLVKKVRKLACEIGLPLGGLALVGTLFVPFVLPRLVGDTYLPAVPATQLLVVASALSLATFWMRPVYLACCLVRQIFIINVSVTIVFALLYPFVVSHWGYLGTACWLLLFHVAGIGLAGLRLRADSGTKS